MVRMVRVARVRPRRARERLAIVHAAITGAARSVVETIVAIVGAAFGT